MPTGLLVYGITSWALMILPIFMYCVQADTKGYAKFHQTWIQMVATSYASLAIVFLLVFIEDSTSTRRALAGSIEMAGLGPFGLLWVGLWSFMMYASNATVLDEGENTPWIFIYFILNGGLLVLHYWFAPEIYAWTKKTPPPKPVEIEAPEVPGVETPEAPIDSTAADDFEKPSVDDVAEPEGFGEPTVEDPPAVDTTLKERIAEKVADARDEPSANDDAFSW
jgi:hypothetical protein